MKKMSLSLLLGATLVPAILPAMAAAADPESVPGCFRNFTFALATERPVDGVRNIGVPDPDRNDDGYVCYNIIEDRQDEPWAFVWVDNRNKWAPEEL